jgi:protein O-mannosyl-transferase
LGKSSRRKRKASVSAAAAPPAPAEISPAIRTAAVVSALFALVFVIYAQVRTHPFINFDDPDYVFANDHVLHGLTRNGVTWAFTHIHAAYWIPLTWVSHMIDAQIFGRYAGGHLLVSVALHALNCVLVFLFLRLATRAMWRSAGVAALFAVHPLHVESVAWISERKDTLSTLFFLLCLLAYTDYVLRRSRISYVASVAALGTGLLAKPMLVTTPIVLLLLDYWPFQRVNVRKLLIEKIPFALCILPAAVVTLFAQRQAISELSKVSVMVRLANSAISYVAYIGKTLWPARLAVIYPYPTRIAPSVAIACALLLVAITAVAVWYRRSAPWLFVGWCWFVVTLVPVIGIVQVGMQSMADRFTYIPHIGFFVAVVWGCAELARHFGFANALPAASAVVIVLLAFVAHSQVRYWSGNVPLFQHAVDVTSNNKLAQFNLAGGFLEAGDYEAAEREYRLAKGLRPEEPVSLGLALALMHRGDLELSRGQVREARAHLAEAVTQYPKLPEGHFVLARVLEKLGDSAAAGEYEQAIRLNHNLYDCRMNYGALLSRLGRDSEAAEQFSQAARIRPQSAEPHVYAALVAAKQHHFQDASQQIERAVAIDHDGSNRVLISAIRIPSRPTAIDEYLAFLRQQSGGR